MNHQSNTRRIWKTFYHSKGTASQGQSERSGSHQGKHYRSEIYFFHCENVPWT